MLGGTVGRAVAVQPVLHEDLVAAGVVVVIVSGLEQLQRAVVRQALATAVAGLPVAGQRHQYLGPLSHPQHRDDRPGRADRAVAALCVDVDLTAVAVVEGALAVGLVENHLLTVGGPELARIRTEPADGGGKGALHLAQQVVGVGGDVGLQRRREAGPEAVRRGEQEIGGVAEVVGHGAPSVR